MTSAPFLLQIPVLPDRERTVILPRRDSISIRDFIPAVNVNKALETFIKIMSVPKSFLLITIFIFFKYLC